MLGNLLAGKNSINQIKALSRGNTKIGKQDQIEESKVQQKVNEAAVFIALDKFQNNIASKFKATFIPPATKEDTKKLV